MDYENFKERFIEDLKDKLYKRGIEADVTVNTVNKLNESYEVAPQDKLTDNVYHYDSQAQIFELGEKFVERQSERGDADIEKSDLDKEEKGSVLGELKAKKEEVAKTPKKEAVEKAAKAKGGEAI